MFHAIEGIATRVTQWKRRPPLRTSRNADLTRFGVVFLLQPCAQFVKHAFFGVVYRSTPILTIVVNR